jgi:hypothetical protein
MEEISQTFRLDDALPMRGKFAVTRTNRKWLTRQNYDLCTAAEIFVNLLGELANRCHREIRRIARSLVPEFGITLTGVSVGVISDAPNDDDRDAEAQAHLRYGRAFHLDRNSV